MGNRCTAQTGFIGENPPFESHQNHLRERARCSCLTGECIAENAGEGVTDAADVGQENDQAGEHIGNRHERHNRGGGLGDPAHTADDHGKDQHPKDDGCDFPRHPEPEQCTGDFKALNAVADAKTGQHAEQSEHPSQPDPSRSKTFADVVHRPTDVMTQVIHLAVVNRQNGFGVFGGNAKEGDQPHPEDRTWPTDGDRSCHTGDISRADGGRQRSHQSLKGTDITLSLLV